MKKIVLFLLGCWLAFQVSAADSAWVTSLPDAKAQAKKENKLILLNFTGLDWCIPCKQMEADIYTKPEFLAYAQTNLVLVQLDFLPIKKQPEDLFKANTALQEEYGVQVFPTVIMVNSDGKPLWAKKGYLKGGPAAMIAELEKAKNAPMTTPTTNTVTPPARN